MALPIWAMADGLFGFFWLQQGLYRPVIVFGGLWPRIGRADRRLSALDRGDHRLDADDIERAAQVVGDRCQAELGAHVFEAAHQERTLIHPLLDAAEGMLDDLAATVENLGPRFEAFSHAIEHVLVFETGRRANIVRASRAKRTDPAGFRRAVIDLRKIAQPAVADQRQQLPGRTQSVGVAPGVYRNSS